MFAFLLALSLVSAPPASVSSPDPLREELDGIAERFHGVLGYSLHHLRTGDRLERRGDEKFPTASTIKLAMLCTAMEKQQKGEIDYYQTRRLRKEDASKGTGFMRHYREGTPVKLKEMLHLMITASENILNHQYFDDGIAGQIPPWVAVASKSGIEARSRSDIAMVHSPSGDYCLAIYTREARDTGVDRDNEQDSAIRAISRAVWRHYHPQIKWAPPAGVEKFSAGPDW